MFSIQERKKNIEAVSKKRVDVLIIGGGVVGCSIAAYASKMGLRCVLVERQDIAYGASGNSTGLAHAGLRYLAQGRIGYVFRESRERRRLEEMAPHWVRPFHFLLPVYQGDPFSLWQVKVGTWIYDWLAMLDALIARVPFPRRHKALNAKEVLQRSPRLKSEGLAGGVEYFVDSQLLDSRFTLGLAQRAAAHGAGIITHAEVTGVDKEIEGVRSVSCYDHLTGERFFIRPQLIINASGAWIDVCRAQIGSRLPILLRSQGIHLIVDRLAEKPLIFSLATPGRVFFVLPVGQDASLVGTTDTAVVHNPDESLPQTEEIQELVDNLFNFFRHLKDQSPQNYIRQSVRDIYWAQRPLARQKGSTVDASREHQVIRDLPFFWSVAGVKLTAGRAVGEEVARQAFYGVRGVAAPKVDLGRLPGGEIENFDSFIEELKAKHATVSASTIEYLGRTYGTRVEEVFGFVQREPRLGESVLVNEPWIYAEAAYAVQEEMALTLNDFLWRRTKWAHFRPLSDEIVYRLAMIFAARLGWVNQEINDQIAAFRQEEQRHRLKVSG